MGRTKAEKLLKEALRLHRIEELAGLIGCQAELAGRVAEASMVRGSFVVSIFSPWPEHGCLSLWFAKPPARLGLPEDPAAWEGRLVRVRGVVLPGKAPWTFWIRVVDPAQIEILAEEPVAEAQ